MNAHYDDDERFDPTYSDDDRLTWRRECKAYARAELPNNATRGAFDALYNKRFNLIYDSQEQLIRDTAAQQLYSLRGVSVSALVIAFEKCDR